MSQYPGAQPPGGPYYAPPPADPYAPPPPPADPYFGAPPPGDPYAQQAQYQAWQAQQPPGYPPPYEQPAYGQQPPYAQPAYGQQPPYAQPAYAQQPPPPPEPSRARSSGSGAAIAGLFLVVLGAWFLFRDQVSFDLGQAWPLIAVVLGILMVIGAFIPRRRG
jgi:hypothetical protein